MGSINLPRLPGLHDSKLSSHAPRCRAALYDIEAHLQLAETRLYVAETRLYVVEPRFKLLSRTPSCRDALQVVEPLSTWSSRLPSCRDALQRSNTSLPPYTLRATYLAPPWATHSALRTMGCATLGPRATLGYALRPTQLRPTHFAHFADRFTPPYALRTSRFGPCATLDYATLRYAIPPLGFGRLTSRCVRLHTTHSYAFRPSLLLQRVGLMAWIVLMLGGVLWIEDLSYFNPSYEA